MFGELLELVVAGRLGRTEAKERIAERRGETRGLEFIIALGRRRLDRMARE